MQDGDQPPGSGPATGPEATSRIPQSETPSGVAGIASSREPVGNEPGSHLTNRNEGLSKDPDNLHTRDSEELSSRNQLWVLALFENSRREQIYEHFDALGPSTDYTLFCALRQEYFRASSWWRRLARLREVTAIRFVKVRKLHPNERDLTDGLST